MVSPPWLVSPTLPPSTGNAQHENPGTGTPCRLSRGFRAVRCPWEPIASKTPTNRGLTSRLDPEEGP
ncbi:hypothetical protein HEB94_006743 [Actinopolymorpha pittospori]|uniref:Uncharacterized protein n=1 Tax=Actinopolymorpha pittospori TaxID=648752 RepID=A0A927N7I2_9ACTN|nr:hypothetical protein [Actinopolymorpha pittospori]